jgi:hypothetical protein
MKLRHAYPFDQSERRRSLENVDLSVSKDVLETVKTRASRRTVASNDHQS